MRITIVTWTGLLAIPTMYHAFSRSQGLLAADRICCDSQRYFETLISAIKLLTSAFTELRML